MSPYTIGSKNRGVLPTDTENLLIKMYKDIVITTGIAIVALSWICGTIYAIIRNDGRGLQVAVDITVVYGIYKIVVFLLSLSPQIK